MSLAPWIEHYRQRLVMIGADLVRSAVPGSVSDATVFETLSYRQFV
ncbi:hypothetical protein ACFO1B_50930 [Dactylosporangium siamense]|nr:hypothetical protein [Dactylosporangium siamense]